MKKSNIVIVGGGWAGLAAAITLALEHEVTLLEAAPVLGGRARSLAKDKTLDNGQHILIGAYQGILDLLEKIGVSEEFCLKRLPLQLSMQVAPDKFIDFSVNKKIIAPFHIIFALLKMPLTIKEKIKAIGLSALLMQTRLKKDISVKALLKNHPEKLITYLWEPLCIAALNTPIEKASAQVFLHVLKQTFAKKDFSDLLLPTCSLGLVFPEQAFKYLFTRAKVLFNHRVTKLAIENQTITGVYIKDKFIAADQVILATSHYQAINLLKDYNALFYETTYNLKQLSHQPIYTVYFQYKQPIETQYPMTGLLNGYGQWLFNLNVRAGLIAIIISAQGQHEAIDNHDLIIYIKSQIQMLYPDWPEPENAWVIREKQATFDCFVGVEALRPETTTKVKGLYLAGDYCNTGLPATLEGAVQSGLQAANHIINNTNI